MAKIISFIKISGTIDDCTCRDTEEGNIIGKKTGPTREKVLNHPDFEQTRRNAGEFKLATKDAKLLRHALSYALDGVKRTTLNSHVLKLMYAAAAKDQVHEIGSRYAAAGDVSVFEGFEFGHELSLDWALPVSFVQGFNIASGSMKVEVPSYIARKRNGFPKAATHFRIVSAGAAINFEEGRYVNAIKTSDLLPVRKKTPEAIYLDHALKVAPGDVVVQVLGIQFFTLVNGKEVLMKGGAVKILAAERVAAEVLVPVDVPQVEKNAEPFTKKRLQAFGDERRKGRGGSGNASCELQNTSCELRATSGEPGKDERPEVQEAGGEAVASTDGPLVCIENHAPGEIMSPVDDGTVDCVEMIPPEHYPGGRLADTEDAILTDGFMADGLPAKNEGRIRRSVRRLKRRPYHSIHEG